MTRYLLIITVNAGLLVANALGIAGEIMETAHAHC